MAGEFDSLRVKIESNSDKARQGIERLITGLNGLRQSTGKTVAGLTRVNNELREMRDLLGGFRSMGDPFKKVNSGLAKSSMQAVANSAESASKSIEKAAHSTKAMTEMLREFRKTGTNFKDAFDITRGAKIKGGKFAVDAAKQLQEQIQKALDNTPLRLTTSKPTINTPIRRWQDTFGKSYDRSAWWKIADERKYNDSKENSFEYFRQMRKYQRNAIAQMPGITPKQSSTRLADGIKKAAEESKVLKTVFDSVKKSAASLFKTIAKIPLAIGSGMVNLITKPFRMVGDAIQGATKRAGRFFASIKRIAVYRLIRSALKAMTQAMREGIDNLYQWSLAVNTSFAPAMNSIATDLLYVKNALGAMISPLIEAFAPIMRGIADSLVSAFNWVQRVLSQLMGRDHWYKAIRVQTQYQEATNNTTKAVKKLRDEIHLMDWDEINNITENDDNGTGSTAVNPVTPNPSEMFVQVEQPLEALEGNNFWERLWSLIKKGWESLKEWWNGVDWAKLGKTIGEKIMGAWNTFTGWWNTHKGEIGEGILKVAGDIYDFFSNLLGEIDFHKMAEDIGTFAGEVWKAATGWFKENKGNIWEGIIKVLNGIWDFIKTAVDSFMKIADPRYEEKKTADETYDITKGIEERYDRNFGTYEGSSRLEAYEQSLKDRDMVNEDIAKLTKQRDKLTKTLDNYFTDESGLIDTERKANYEKWYNNPGMKQAKYWTDNDFKAYVQLRNSLDTLDVYYDSLIKKRSKVSAVANIFSNIDFPDISGYDKKISAALRKQEKIVVGGYGEIATKALKEYLTSVNWGDGGTITASDIEKALVKAGLPKSYASEASRDIYGYLIGTYSGTGWNTLGNKTLEYIAGALHNNADVIPYEYMGIASEALQTYISGVDWAYGGTYSANGIAQAFIGAGIPEDVAWVAALAASNWFKDFAPTDLGMKTGASVMQGTKRGILDYKPEELSNAMNQKLGQAQKKLTPLQVQLVANTKQLAPQISAYKPPQISIPAVISVQSLQASQGLKSWIDRKNGTNIGALFRAQGGFVPQGSLFVAGEVPGQAEMVGNINGKTGVVSGREISGIGDAVWSTGNNTANLLEQLIRVVQNKNLTISPSAALGQTVAKSSRLYAMQTG